MDKTLITGSKHFTLHSLAEGVFTAIALDGGSALCNSGLIDLGDQTLIFDTFLTPQAALDLRRCAQELFGRTPQIVINSHYHNDHIWGNQVFEGEAQIISSTRTRELITTAGMEEYRDYSANSAKQLESLRLRRQNTDDEQGQKELLLWLGYYEGLVEALPNLKVCTPNITFNNRLEMHGAKNTCELITFQGAHTGSDTVLYIPQAGIVFMSDLLFVGCHPYLADGDPLSLLEALKEISQLEASSYVPGHGPVGSIEDLKLLIEYIEGCFETAQMLADIGNVNEDRINELKIPEKYQDWIVPQFYRSNIRFLYERLNPAKGDKQAP